MIKFKEQDGLLFRMLEEPTPLTPDAKMPVLVRLIQDDSPMGMYNKKHRDTIYGIRLKCFLHPIIAVFIDNDNIVNAQSWEYYRYEIIGTPVKEGSPDWAWYQMMQGEKICHKKFPSIMYCESDYGIMRKEMRYNYVECYMSVLAWLNRAYDNGWQIYHEPKPLLADAKVGDLCQRRDGKWVQIDRLLSIGGMPLICYEIGGLRYMNNGEQLNSKLSELGIISTEPLAPEETKEWALQMMKLGKCVCHVKAPSIKYHRPTHYVKRVVRENCTDDMSDAVWMKGADPTGWQLYEPKPEPIFTTGDKVTDGVIEGTIIHIEDAIADVCPSTDEYKIELCNLNHIPESPKKDDVEKPKPESENIIHGHIPADMRLKYIDLVRYKVGDSVICEYHRSPLPKQVSYERIIDINDVTIVTQSQDGSVCEYDINGNHGDINGWHIDRVISPCEHIVTIGCLSGTVRPVSTNGIHIWFHLIGVDDKIIATIRISSLDKQTRELVEGLLEAQERGDIK